MTTLEEEIIIPLQRQMAAQSQPRPAKPTFWNIFLSISFGFLFGVVVGGLFVLRQNFLDSWRQSVEKFQWLVLAQGDPVAIDEVGRYLKKLDGVSDVQFLSPEAMLDLAKADSTLAADLSLIEGNPFPASWRVHWAPDQFRNDRLQQVLEEVRVFPGVVDVSSDPAAFERVQYFEGYARRAKMFFLLFVSSFLLFAAAGLGRFLFSKKSNFQSRLFFFLSLIGVGSASAGAALIYYLW